MRRKFKGSALVGDVRHGTRAREVRFRATAAEVRQLCELAEARGLSVSEFLRELARAAYESLKQEKGANNGKQKAREPDRDSVPRKKD